MPLKRGIFFGVTSAIDCITLRATKGLPLFVSESHLKITLACTAVLI
jgi:hypothetical protein